MVENPSDIAHGMWSNNESMKSSTWKELTAVKKHFVFYEQLLAQ